jgi:hypothetical protein
MCLVESGRIVLNVFQLKTENKVNDDRLSKPYCSFTNEVAKVNMLKFYDEEILICIFFALWI